MGTGWLAWTCLLLATGAPGAADDIVHMNQRGFQIPIRIEPQRQAEVSELLLYLSRDQGRTWEIYGRAKPDKRGFDFFAQSDGLLYFSIAVLDRKGRQDPVDIYHSPVGQKIWIDTVKPVVRILSAERSGDEVQVGWEAQEENPDWPTLRLEYRIGDAPNGSWTPLPIEPGPRGNLRFRPNSPGSVTLRMSLRDHAGNEGVEEKIVGGHFDRAVMNTSAVAPATSPAPSPVSEVPPASPVSSFPPGGPTPPPAPIGRSDVGMVAHSTAPAARASSAPLPGDSGSFQTPRGQLPTLQYVNKRQVKLGFNVTRIGPSGLGGVDVYITTDEGATWEKSSADPNVSLPLTPDTHGGSPVHGTVTVALQKESVVYGFYLVIKSKAGRGKPPPRPGDMPQTRIEMDTTAPVATLRAPQPTPGRQDSLILTWDAEDRNLAQNPISLEWSKTANGPWEFIGDAQLPNTGKYTWVLREGVPHMVYLRLTVRDIAGNVAVAQTDQPVLIDLVDPEIVTTGVEVAR
jgi:hypothetical protein